MQASKHAVRISLRTPVARWQECQKGLSIATIFCKGRRIHRQANNDLFSLFSLCPLWFAVQNRADLSQASKFAVQIRSILLLSRSTSNIMESDLQEPNILQRRWR
eukprot:g62892.t1